MSEPAFDNSLNEADPPTWSTFQKTTKSKQGNQEEFTTEFLLVNFSKKKPEVQSSEWNRSLPNYKKNTKSIFRLTEKFLFCLFVLIKKSIPIFIKHHDRNKSTISPTRMEYARGDELCFSIYIFCQRIFINMYSLYHLHNFLRGFKLDMDNVSTVKQSRSYN